MCRVSDVTSNTEKLPVNVGKTSTTLVPTDFEKVKTELS